MGARVIVIEEQQARAHGADPYRYLEWVLEKLMHHRNHSGEEIDALLPGAWVTLQRDAAGKIA